MLKSASLGKVMVLAGLRWDKARRAGEKCRSNLPQIDGRKKADSKVGFFIATKITSVQQERQQQEQRLEHQQQERLA